MKQSITGHVVKLHEWRNWSDYENNIHSDEIRPYNIDDMHSTNYYYDVYTDVPSKKECAKICAEMSGQVVTYSTRV